MAETIRATGGERQAPREPGPLRTLLVALAVCGTCAAVVTASVVVLRPYQVANRQWDREMQVRALVAGLPGISDLVTEAGDARPDTRVVELATGAYATDVTAEQLLATSEDERESVRLPRERDLAGIGSRPRFAPVYVFEREGAVHTVILPVSGQGYLATMRGYLALAGDGGTIRGITFTEQEETPGLGSEIENPVWQRLWRGKRLRDEDGNLRVRVVRDAPSGPDAVHQVQGISGATKTGDGVSNLVRFWVGPDGFGPYLERLREGGAQ